ARPFGGNVLLSGVRLPVPQEDVVAVCIEERVPVLSFFWGDPSPHVAPAHAAGITVLHQVGSVAAAVEAVRAGVDVVIAQGVEAGGDVGGPGGTVGVGARGVGAVAPRAGGGGGGGAGRGGGRAGGAARPRGGRAR